MNIFPNHTYSDGVESYRQILFLTNIYIFIYTQYIDGGGGWFYRIGFTLFVQVFICV